MSADEERKKKKLSAGYRQPPIAGQFQTGVSGNPRGRPRKKALPQGSTSTSFPTREAIRIEAKQLISVNDASGRYTMEARQALFRSLLARGMGPNGSVYAQRTALKLLAEEDERYYREQMEGIKSAERYISHCRDINTKRAAQGLEPIAFLPSPDDYVIDWTTLEVRVEGPIDEAGKATAEFLCAARDLCYEMALYRNEMVDMVDEEGRVTQIGIYFGLYLLFQQRLWPRMRVTPKTLDEEIWPRSSLGQNNWAKHLQARCKELRLPFLSRVKGSPAKMIPLAKLGMRRPMQLRLPPVPPNRRQQRREK